MSDGPDVTDGGSETSDPTPLDRRDVATDRVELQPPNFRTAKFGTIQEVWRTWRHRKKEKKLAGKGYIKWYVIEDSYPTPKYVQPEMEGGGIPELEYDGGKYLFPRKGMLPGRESGMWTVIHKKGQSEPVNLHEPDENVLKADELKEFLTLSVTSTPPSWLSGLDIDTTNLVTYSIFGIIAVAILWGMMTGGLV